MKKLIGVCVALSMLLSLALTACGPAETAKNTTAPSGSAAVPAETGSPLPESPVEAEALAWAERYEIVGDESGLEESCTLEEAVELIWRAAGFQAPATRILRDPDAPAEEQRPDAIVWAEQRGVTWEGWSPEAACTRAAAVTLLWRRAGCPEIQADAAFSDVPADAEVFPALRWAAARGIVASGGAFSPDAVMTRGEVVNLLWRARAMFTPDAVGRAKDYGYVPEELWEDQDKIVTMSELCGLIENIIAWHNPESVDEWRDNAAEALASDETVQVDEALAAFLAANIAMGIDEDLGYMDGGLEMGWENVARTIDPDPSFDWWEGCRMEYPMFKGLEDYRDPNWWEPESEPMFTLRRFGQTHLSLVDMTYIFPHDDAWTYGFGRDVTCREAIRAATVWAESDEAIYIGAEEYVSFDDAGTYDTTIITPELLAAPSDLPEATRTSVPGDWRGVGMSISKNVMRCYRHFKESDVRVLAENGLNFTKLFFDFNTLKFPYKNEEVDQVNLEQLRDLDRLVAWCIQYGVHLQLSPNGFAGYSGGGNWVGEKRLDELPLESWEEFVAIWGMLAKRYAGIPSKYLSFELINEWMPSFQEDFDAYADYFFRAADAIWAADPERLVFDSTAAMWSPEDQLAWLELMAGHGIALGIHPYFPDQICVWDEFTVYPDDPQWPIPWFPSGVESGGEVTVEGDLGGGTLTVYFAEADWPTQVYVYADGKLLEELDPTYIMHEVQSDRGSEPFVKGYDIQIPAGTAKLTFKTGDQKVWYNGFKFTKDGAASGVMANDYRLQNLTGESHFTVDENGWSSADGRMYTMEDIYEAYMEPVVDIARKYGVGVMVNEMGCFGSDIGAVQAVYLNDLIAMLEEKGIGWCYCETRYAGIFDVYRGEGDEMAIYCSDDLTHRTYECADGHLEEYWYRNDLMGVFRKYTLGE